MPTRKGTHEKSQVPNVESVVGSVYAASISFATYV